MSDLSFDLDTYLSELPAAAPFAGYPRYNLTGGHNDPMLIPTDALATAAHAAILREGPNLALYNMGHGAQGYIPLRALIANRLSRLRLMSCTSDNVLITTGSGNGLDLILGLLIRPGDIILCENHSFSYFIRSARTHGAEVLGLPMDAEGIDTHRLAEILSSLHEAGKRPRLLYTIPTIQNPTGSILPLHRRKELIALSQKFSFPIIEDECYSDLIWGSEPPPPPLYAMAPHQVIFVGTFSKILAPALRIGYIVAQHSTICRLLTAKDIDGTGAVDQLVTYEYFSEFGEAHVSALVSTLERKKNFMLECIDQYLGTSVETTNPQGGIFLWLKFPDGCDVMKLAPHANKLGLGFNYGPEWSCNKSDGANYIRLCFAFPDQEMIEAGIRLLADICHDAFGFPLRSANITRSK